MQWNKTNQPHSSTQRLQKRRGERIFMINLIIPLSFLAIVPGSARWFSLAFILLIAGVHLLAFRGSQRWKLACLVAELVLMVPLTMFASPGYIWMIFYPTAILGAAFNRKQILGGIVAICAFLLLVTYFESFRFHMAFADWLMVLAGLVAGIAATYGTWWQTQTAKSREQLKQANMQIERLTKVAERDRISQDLHDVMGHELSMITLKAQLVERLIDRDPKRAKSEVADIERAARSALTRVREYIADIRQPNLHEEWKDAKNLLAMAGIEPRLEMTDFLEPAHSPISHVFAMCIREAVTNMVRHSSARQAYLKLWKTDRHIHLVIADDGKGLPPSPSVNSGDRSGNGMNGMRARLAAIEGQLDIWSNGSIVSGDALTMPIVIPWGRGTWLHFRAPLPEPTLQPMEEVERL